MNPDACALVNPAIGSQCWVAVLLSKLAELLVFPRSRVGPLFRAEVRLETGLIRRLT